MAFSVQMPALGESVTEGTVTRWLKQEGDRVEVDEPLLEVSTDKVDTEIPSPAAGVLQRIVAGEDETVEVGGELAVIGDEAGGPLRPEPAGGETAAPSRPSRRPPRRRAAAEDAAGACPAGGARSGAAGRSGARGRGHRRSRCRSSVRASPRAPSPAGSSRSATSVEVDEPLLEVSTDKVDTEIPSPVAGTLLEITADEDETVDVGGAARRHRRRGGRRPAAGPGTTGPGTAGPGAGPRAGARAPAGRGTPVGRRRRRPGRGPRRGARGARAARC